jgi:iron complex transport system substrate-binding protein
VHLSPSLPFGWVDLPPSVNRLIGLRWLGKVLYPSLFSEDISMLTREFYRDFYHVSVSETQLRRLFA